MPKTLRLTRHSCTDGKLFFDDPHAKRIFYHGFIHKLAENVLGDILVQHFLKGLQSRCNIVSQTFGSTAAGLERGDRGVRLASIPCTVSVISLAKRDDADIILN
jgi:hypothetical protein